MNKFITKVSTTLLGFAMVFSFVSVAPVYAANGAHAAQSQATHMADMKDRANREIDRRVTALNAVIARVGEMKKVSDTDKAALVAKAQDNITVLTTLKTKIQADTDLATLKTDVQSITKAYRIFMLILPQIHITAAADRMGTTADMLTTIVGQLQTRITAAQTAGHDVSAMQAKITDMQAKIADANTQYANAEHSVAGLVPDQGTQATIDSNKATLVSARAMIKAGGTDLKTARDDAKNIRTALTAMGM